MIKVNYNNVNGNIVGFYPEPYADYSNIPLPNIEIDQETWIDCINNQGFRKVDIDTLKIVHCEPSQPTPEEIKEKDLIKLDNEYQPQFLEVTRAWANANMDGNTKLMDSIKTLKSTLTDEYLAKKEVIENA